MVALALRTVDPAPVRCAARPLVVAASTALERHDAIAAAVQLREAVRLYLLAEFEWHDVGLPKRTRDRTSGNLLRALKRAGVLDSLEVELIGEILTDCNALAHCRLVPVDQIGRHISRMNWLLGAASHLTEAPSTGRGVL